MPGSQMPEASQVILAHEAAIPTHNSFLLWQEYSSFRHPASAALRQTSQGAFTWKNTPQFGQLVEQPSAIYFPAITHNAWGNTFPPDCVPKCLSSCRGTNASTSEEPDWNNSLADRRVAVKDITPIKAILSGMFRCARFKLLIASSPYLMIRLSLAAANL